MSKSFTITRCHSRDPGDYIPRKGELIFENDTGFFMLGNGVTPLLKLPRMTSVVFAGGHHFSNPDALELYINARLNESIVCVDDLI